jgi:hypothetical protein
MSRARIGAPLCSSEGGVAGDPCSRTDGCIRERDVALRALDTDQSGHSACRPGVERGIGGDQHQPPRDRRCGNDPVKGVAVIRNAVAAAGLPPGRLPSGPPCSCLKSAGRRQGHLRPFAQPDFWPISNRLMARIETVSAWRSRQAIAGASRRASRHGPCPGVRIEQEMLHACSTLQRASSASSIGLEEIHSGSGLRSGP